LTGDESQKKQSYLSQFWELEKGEKIIAVVFSKQQLFRRQRSAKGSRVVEEKGFFRGCLGFLFPERAEEAGKRAAFEDFILNLGSAEKIGAWQEFRWDKDKEYTKFWSRKMEDLFDLGSNYYALNSQNFCTEYGK
jgi:hypothetical protein